MTIAIISIAGWIITVIGYVIFNLYNKNKKLENMVINQSNFIYEVKQNMKLFDQLVNKIDSQIWVQSDPEFLALFENLKEIQQLAQKYEG
jgi:hypothetical protein